MGHTHLNEVIDRADLLPRRDVVLSHFSARYTDDDVYGIVRRRLPEELLGVVRIIGAGVV
jgi:ribonuclease Z